MSCIRTCFYFLCFPLSIHTDNSFNSFVLARCHGRREGARVRPSVRRLFWGREASSENKTDRDETASGLKRRINELVSSLQDQYKGGSSLDPHPPPPPRSLSLSRLHSPCLLMRKRERETKQDRTRVVV